MVQQGSIVSLARGQYRLCEALGGSAYGVVWRAEAAAGAASGCVAIKLVNTEQMARAPALLQHHWIACARQEIDFLAGLAPWDARHIVRLLDSGSHEGRPALALELLDGDLAAHLALERSLEREVDPIQALDWIGQVNQALAKVHAAGFRYLDLKPGNLLIERRSKLLKLADFGTTCALLEAPTHSYAGTANWQAPEQFFPDATGLYRTGPRSDYFALGALFYYLVCGRLLRYGAACAQAYRDHGRDGAHSLRTPHGAVPATLQPDELAAFAGQFGGAASEASALLAALLAPVPGHRPQHALDISRMLDRVHARMAHAPLARAA